MSRALLLLALFASSPVALAAKKAASLEGTWSSPSCKDRAYERRITFNADGTFRADDRVSPCPPNVACVWSGIITRTGTFRIAGARVKLSSEAGDTAKAASLPASLTFSKKGELSEGSCAYGRFAGNLKP